MVVTKQHKIHGINSLYSNVPQRKFIGTLNLHVDFPFKRDDDKFIVVDR